MLGMFAPFHNLWSQVPLFGFRETEQPSDFLPALGVPGKGQAIISIDNLTGNWTQSQTVVSSFQVSTGLG